MNWPIVIILLAGLGGCSARTAPLWTFETAYPITAAAVLGNSRELAVVTRGGISVLNAETGEEISRISGVDAEINAIACTATTCWIGGGEHETGYLGSIDMRRGELTRLASVEKFSALNAVAIDADGNLATGHADETVILWKAGGMEPRKQLTIPDGLEIYALRFVGTTLVVGNDQGDLVLWDGASDTPMRRVNLEGGAILSLAVAGDHLLAGGWQHLDVLDLDLPAQRQRLKFDHASVLACDATADGELAWCGGSDGSMSRIELNGLRISTVRLHRDEIRFAKVLGDTVITASKDKSVRAWSQRQLSSASVR